MSITVQAGSLRALALAALAAVALASSPGLSAQADDARPAFGEWLASVRADAAARGVRAEILDQALGGLTPIDSVRERDRSQAEFVLRFDSYVKRWLTPKFVRAGREHARTHRALLARVSKKYGVPAPVLLAIWGLESNYGRFGGVRPVVATLATLAYDTRRPAMFRAELLDALTILDHGDIDLERMQGSWAGAMGQPQFMPSSYLKYAQDFDGDGHRDIWGSPADVFASIANYLAQRGWVAHEPWGREVSLAKAAHDVVDAVPLRTEGCRAEQAMTAPRPIAEWQRLGVRLKGGASLPGRAPDASLVRVGDRAFLVHRNYEAILQYNCAHHYALGIGLLSDRLR